MDIAQGRLGNEGWLLGGQVSWSPFIEGRADIREEVGSRRGHIADDEDSEREKDGC